MSNGLWKSGLTVRATAPGMTRGSAGDVLEIRSEFEISAADGAATGTSRRVRLRCIAAICVGTARRGNVVNSNSMLEPLP